MKNAPQERSIRVSGSVKNFDRTKGYGYLLITNAPNLFFHIQGAKVLGTPYPNDGDELIFTLEGGPKGAYAADWEFEDKYVEARRREEGGSSLRKREPRSWNTDDNAAIRVWRADE